MNEPHPIYRLDALRALRYIGIGALLLLLIAEWFIEPPGPFGLHAGAALLGVLLAAVVALFVGRLLGLARGTPDDD